MHISIIEAVNYLKEAGLRISPGEMLDFCQALQLIELHRDNVLTAAMCTLAKDKHAGDILVAAIGNYLQNKTSANALVIPPAIDVRAALANPPQLNDTEFLNRLRDIKDSIRHELMLINESSISGGSGSGGSGTGIGEGCHSSSDATIVVQGSQDANETYPLKPTNLQQIDLAQADTEQLAEINKIIMGIGRRLAAHKGYRKKPAPTGVVDMRRTVRQAAARGGMPVALKKMRRVPGKPHICTLCDLSGSMAQYSVFFLQLLVSLQHRFSKLKSFAYVDRIAEVTNLAKTTSGAWDFAARTILREAQISSTGFSNYGRVWEQFCNEFMHNLTPQTTLIILGDARNNWQPDGAEYLRCITDRCRRTIWLNPLPRTNWSNNDCIMETYAPFCSQVLECRNALQLSRAIKEIL